MQQPDFLFPVYDAAFDQGAQAYREGRNGAPPRESFLFWVWELGWRSEHFLMVHRRGKLMAGRRAPQAAGDQNVS